MSVLICQGRTIKLRSHMRGAVAERRRADFDIPAPLPRVCSHIRGADAGGSAISWGQWWFGARGFEAGAVSWVLDPFLAERFLLPLRLRSATAHVWTHVMICVEANFPPAPAPARVRPRMCERTFNRLSGFWLRKWRGVPLNVLGHRVHDAMTSLLGQNLRVTSLT